MYNFCEENYIISLNYIFFKFKQMEIKYHNLGWLKYLNVMKVLISPN